MPREAPRRPVMLKPVLALALCCCACAAPTQPASVAPEAALSSAAPSAEQQPTPAVAPDLVAMQLDATQTAIVGTSERTEVVARVRIRTEARPAQTRPPVDLALVIDTSASMRGAPIERAREAAAAMVASLRDGDRVQVVAFHSRAESLIAPTVITAHGREQVLRAVDQMAAVGTTALGAGLDLAVHDLMGSPVPESTPRIVVLSDGLPNDDQAVRTAVTHAQQRGIPITTMGLGLEYDETLLGDIASTSGGAFHFIETPDQVATVFRDEVLRIERVIATGAQLQLLAGPDVLIRDVVGHTAGGTGTRSAALLVGDLADAGTRDVFVRLDVGPHAPGSTIELLDANLTYVDGTGTGLSLDRSGFLAVDAVDDKAAAEQTRVLATELDAARAITAATILRAGLRVHNGDLKGAIAIAETTERRARSLGKQHEDKELLALADELRSLKETWVELQRQARRNRQRDENWGHRDRPHPAPVKHKLAGPAARSAKRSHDAAWSALH